MYSVGASRKVHQASLNRLVGAPISFFDTTPVGRVLNRFSKDTDDMDYQLCVSSMVHTLRHCIRASRVLLAAVPCHSLPHACHNTTILAGRPDTFVSSPRSPQSVSELGNCLFQLAATLIFISIIQPYFLAGAVPLMLIYYVIQKVCAFCLLLLSCCGPSPLESTCVWHATWLTLKLGIAPCVAVLQEVVHRDAAGGCDDTESHLHELQRDPGGRRDAAGLRLRAAVRHDQRGQGRL